jgi:hypothetical protein
MIQGSGEEEFRKTGSQPKIEQGEKSSNLSQVVVLRPTA